MDNLNYLNRISAQNRPTKPAPLFSGKFWKFVIGGLALAVFIIIVSSMLSSISTKEKDLVTRINLRTTNLTQTIASYQPFIKSSKLKAHSISLSGILTDSSRKISEVITSAYSTDEDKAASARLTDEESAHISELKDKLDKAKLNGILDRIYARELTLEIALLMSLESEAIARTDNASVKEVLSSSYTSLEQLHTTLSAYSDASN